MFWDIVIFCITMLLPLFTYFITVKISMLADKPSKPRHLTIVEFKEKMLSTQDEWRGVVSRVGLYYRPNLDDHLGSSNMYFRQYCARLVQLKD